MAWVRVSVVSLLWFALAGCGGGGAPAAPTGSNLPAEVRAAMERAIQDEFHAETIYQGVVDDLGAFQPFVNVLMAEQRHSASIAQLFTRRGLAAPSSQWTLATVPRFGTLSDACRAAAAAERENITMYDDFLRLNLPADVRQVFESNRTASLSNHLPAFERCA